MRDRSKLISVGWRLTLFISNIIATVKIERLKLQINFDDILDEIPDRAVQYQPISTLTEAR